MDYSDIKVKRAGKGEPKKLYGNAIHHIELDNTYTAETLTYMKQGGAYKQRPYRLQKKGICDFYNVDTFFYKDLVANSNYTFPCPCPMPKVRPDHVGKI